MSVMCARGVWTMVHRMKVEKGSMFPGSTCMRFTVPYCQKAPSEQPMYSKDEKRDFMAVFTDLNRDLSFIDIPQDLKPHLSKHLARCIQYTVPDGKKNRGFSVNASYKLLASKQDLTEDNIRLSTILGWTVEFLQAFFLVADDIMDHSESRRGKPCWYKVDDIGLNAFNDSIILETCVYSMLSKHFKDKPYYKDLLAVMHETTRYTAYGQALDLISADMYNRKKGTAGSLDHFTMDRYKAIVKYKTSYYSFYLPVALAMHMAEVKDDLLFKRAETILLDMGHFFQVQDDYLDCFGDPQVTGKQGTDIQDGKCSWLITVALQRANHDQKAELALRYGSADEDDIAWVKKLYTQLGLQRMYTVYEEEFYKDIQELIQQIPGDSTFPQQVFFNFLNRIYKRQK